MDPFKWQPIDVPGGAALTYRGVEVARLCTRDGQTWATLRYPDRVVQRPCSTFDRGRRGVMIWAARWSGPLKNAIDRRVDAEKSDRPSSGIG